MIHFTCRCGHRYSVAETQAGDDLQCDSCGLLLTVPTHSEIPGLTEDGTYAVDDVRRVENKQRVRELGYVFKPGTVDAAGQEIDLRRTTEELERVGAVDDLRTSDEGVGPRPRYDPESGELLAPILIKPHPADEHIDTADIPLAKPALTYAVGGVVGMKPASSVAALLRPVNLLVMLVVLAIQLTLQIITFFIIATGFWFASPLLLMLQIGMFGHYGNVIDEIGPGEANELPRPMRDLRFREDFWTPLCTLLGGAAICYAPGLVCWVAAANELSIFLSVAFGLTCVAGFVVLWRIVWMLAVNDWSTVSWKHEVLMPFVSTGFALAMVIGPGLLLALAGAPALIMFGATLLLAGIGTLFVPAVMLTIATSGSSANLRPDRVLTVMKTVGRRYIVPTIAWAIGAPAYLIALLLLSGVSVTIGNVVLFGGLRGLPSLGIDALLLGIGIYAMHVMTYDLGWIYRDYHQTFPWVYQRFVSARKHRSAAMIAEAIKRRKLERAQIPALRRAPGPR